MTADFIAVASACSQGSEAGAMTFPQVLAALSRVDVERYHADLVRGEKTYYRGGSETCVVPGTPHVAGVSRNINCDEIADALRAVQARRIDYLTFCQRIAEAGCVGYHVSLAGRRAVYYDRDGQTFVEPFPPAP